jgi:hypothetical protein
VVNYKKNELHSNFFVAPPSYEEAMLGATSNNDSDDSEYISGTTGYNPRYAPYTLQTTV